jgi:hypothetical protein
MGDVLESATKAPVFHLREQREPDALYLRVGGLKTGTTSILSGSTPASWATHRKKPSSRSMLMSSDAASVRQ